MVTATMASKGQLTVPKESRDLLGLKPGDEVEIVSRSGDAVLRRRRTISLDELMGSLPTHGISRTLEELQEDLGDPIVEDAMRR